jgi:hypothetical protein
MAVAGSASSEYGGGCIDTSLPAGGDFASTGDEVPIEPAGRYVASPRSTIVLPAG